jgi:DNA-binding MarR family transcriptional regulator
MPDNLDLIDKISFKSLSDAVNSAIGAARENRPDVLEVATRAIENYWAGSVRNRNTESLQEVLEQLCRLIDSVSSPEAMSVNQTYLLRWETALRLGNSIVAANEGQQALADLRSKGYFLGEKILLHLQERGSGRTKELAEILGISPPSCSAALKRLMYAGYVCRVGDARGWYALTGLGQATAKEASDLPSLRLIKEISELLLTRYVSSSEEFAAHLVDAGLIPEAAKQPLEAAVCSLFPIYMERIGIVLPFRPRQKPGDSNVHISSAALSHKKMGNADWVIWEEKQDRHDGGER